MIKFSRLSISSALAACALFAAGALQAQENYSQWSGSRLHFLNTSATGANVTGDVANFPVFVRLGAADSAIFKAAKTGGADIRFAKLDGTRLNHQTESWDSAGRTAALWVLVDTVKGNNSTQAIKLYWGKADAADSSNGAAVFDTNSFVAVWHMAGTGDVPDATANGFTATNNGTTANSAGATGPARTFNGTNQYLAKSNNAKFNPAQNLTLSAWAYTTSWVANPNFGSKHILHKGSATGATSTWGLRDNSTGSTIFETGPTQATVGIPNPATNTWLLFHGTYGGGFGKMYMNGAQVASVANNDSNLRTSNTQEISIGRRSGSTDGYFGGSIDEARVQKVVRSADWVKLEFENQKAAQTLVQASLAPTNLSYLANPANYVVNNAITPNTATVTGTVDSFTVSPALPAGLALNKTSGTISGTPTSATATAKYAVTATNGSGSVTDSVSITVTAGLPAAPTIAYTPTTASYTAGTAITAVTPALGGTVDSVTVAPALPAGLVLNKTTGVLSGTPTVAAASANYVFTATNLGGSAKDTINITVAAGAEVYSTWGRHKTIWINTANNGANVAGNVLNFPVLVRLTPADSLVLNSLASGGADLRFTKAGDAVRLPHEIESWDSATKTAAVWVLVDTVRGNNLSQTIRAHVGKSGVSSLSSGGSVFDTTTNYVAVWHLGGTGNISDATFNGFSGTDRGPATTATTGLAGGSRGFNGTTQYLGVPHNAKFNILQNLSVSAWINSTSWLGADGSAEGSKYVVNKGSGQNGTALWGLRDNTSGNFIFETEATANGVLSTPSDGIALNVWHHVAGTYGGGDAKLYVDGVAVNTLPATIDLRTTNDSIGIGRRGRVRDANHYFNGSIDEVRVQKVLRSADWIKLEYQSQKPAQTTVSFTQPVGILGGGAARLSGVASLSVKGLTSGMAFRVQGVEVAANGSARISLVDMSGRAVWSGAFATGMSNLVWNGLDNAGHAVPAGIYTAHVTVKDASGTSHVLNARVPYTH